MENAADPENIHGLIARANALLKYIIRLRWLNLSYRSNDPSHDQHEHTD